jgi:cytochrome c biogenesis protein CcmG/thiol:disulfide interchange protein DsbE
MICTGVPIIGFLGLLVWASVFGSGLSGAGVNREFVPVMIESKPAEDFNLELIDGTAIQLSDLRGKVILLDFWASWCEPCRYEARILNNAYSEYSRDLVEFIGVNIWDNESSANAFIDEFEVLYLNVIDKKGNIAVNYGVAGVPEKFFIGPDGTILKKFRGPISADTLDNTLLELLEEHITQ